jgi:hypothetical protein
LGPLLDGPLDEEWEKRQSEAPLLKKKPSEYLTSGNWFYATEPEESTLPYVMERIGEDTVLFASDYPHWDGSFPYMTSTVKGRKISLTNKKIRSCAQRHPALRLGRLRRDRHLKVRPQAIFSFIFLIFFIVFVYQAQDWRLQARLYPWAIGIPMSSSPSSK